MQGTDELVSYGRETQNPKSWAHYCASVGAASLPASYIPPQPLGSVSRNEYGIGKLTLLDGKCKCCRFLIGLEIIECLNLMCPSFPLIIMIYTVTIDCIVTYTTYTSDSYGNNVEKALQVSVFLPLW